MQRAWHIIAAMTLVAALAVGCAPAEADSDSSSNTPDQGGAPSSPSVAAPPHEPPAAPPSSAPGFAVTAPVAVEDFRGHVLRYPRTPDATGGTPASVCVEYEAAATGFPVPLPDGYAFPLPLPSMSAQGGWPFEDCQAQTSGAFERGTGLGMATGFWFGATATAALADLERGDEAAALEHLDAMDRAWTDAVIELFNGSDEVLSTHPAAAAARDGDLSLLEEEAWRFLLEPAHREMAEAAGDLIEPS